jgi:hypothetical protein
MVMRFIVLPTFIVHEAVRRGELEIILRDYMRPPMGMYAVPPPVQEGVGKDARLH